MIHYTKASLRATYIGRDPEFWGERYDDEQECTVFASVDYILCCTAYATMIRQMDSAAVVHGFLGRDNPAAALWNCEVDGQAADLFAALDAPPRMSLACGHDFAVFAGRFIVDPWVSDIEAVDQAGVYDLHDPADQAKIRVIYGDPARWCRAELVSDGRSVLYLAPAAA